MSQSARTAEYTDCISPEGKTPQRVAQSTGAVEYNYTSAEG